MNDEEQSICKPKGMVEMSDSVNVVMSSAYLYVKAFHILFVASWFAGLFYLPRIFVNMAQETNPQALERLLGMSHRLYRFMTILMIDFENVGFILFSNVLKKVSPLPKYSQSRKRSPVTH